MTASAISARASGAAGQPGKRARQGKIVLATLIIVAAVANLPLAMANVALPSIGALLRRLADPAQPGRRRLLARPGLLGALAGRAGRPLRPQADALLGVALAMPAALICGLCPDDRDPDRRAPLRRVRRRHGLPDHPGPDRGAVGTRAGAHPLDRAVGGHRRRHQRLRPAALRLAVGASSPGTRSSSSSCRWRWWRFHGAQVRARRTSTRPRSRSTTWAASSRWCWSGRSSWPSTLRRSPACARWCWGCWSSPLWRWSCSSSASGGPRTRSTTSRSPPAPPSGWRRSAGIIVFGSLMGAMFIGQQFLQNVLGYSTVDAGAAILPAAVFMILVAPRSAKLVEERGARFTLLVGYVFVLLGFVTMLLLWNEGIPYWMVGARLCLPRHRRRAGGHAGLALADGSVPVTRVGMASGTADLQRDLGGALMQSIFGALLAAGYAAAMAAAIAAAPKAAQITSSVTSQLENVLRQRPDRWRRNIRSMRPRSRPRPRPRSWPAIIRLHRRHHRRADRRGAGLLHVPQAGRGAQAAGRVPRPGYGIHGGCRSANRKLFLLPAVINRLLFAVHCLCSKIAIHHLEEGGAMTAISVPKKPRRPLPFSEASCRLIDRGYPLISSPASPWPPWPSLR